MKKICYLHIAALAAVMGCLSTGCQDEFTAEYDMAETDGTGENDGSRTQLTEKILTGITAGNLSTLLTDDEKATVQRLVLDGELCGADILFIKTGMPALVELDMAKVTFKVMGTDSDYYATDTNGNFTHKLETENVIGNRMFYENINLKKIVIPDCVTEIMNEAFYRCENLNEVVLPYKLKKIGTYAFCRCTNLKNVEFNPYLKEIDRYAFDTSGLKSVHIPKNVQFVSYSAFCNIDSLESVVIDNGNAMTGEYIFNNCKNLKRVQLDDEMETIPKYFMRNCTGLEEITLPAKLKTIESEAFTYTSLRKITIPQEVINVRQNAFSSNDSLREVIFMPEKTNLESGVFFDCRKLEKINLPNIDEIPDYMFRQCYNLKNITIPETVKRIGLYAFENTALTELTINPAVTTLGEKCLANTDLKTLTVPETVTSVERSILNGCRNLENVYWNSECDVTTELGYNNAFLFLNSKNGSTVKWDRDIKNVVIDGVAEKVECSNNSSFLSFGCPQDITVKKVEFTKNFSGWTSVNSKGNWYTISLPFKPTKIVTEDGRILAPFGSSMETEDTKPFWLRTASEEGFVNATDIEAYTPYIICMPNDPDYYLPEYNISGNVTFIGENITMKATPEVIQGIEGPGYKFYPALEYIAPNENIFTVGTWGSDNFINNYEVRPFGAYMVVENQGNGGTEAVDMTSAGKASRAAMMYEKKPGVPHISDMK